MFAKNENAFRFNFLYLLIGKLNPEEHSICKRIYILFVEKYMPIFYYEYLANKCYKKFL